MRRVDVVVVGAGIAGGAMATVLARSGVDVLLLERDQVFRDRVRGETMFPWGVAELQRLGLRDELVDAGGGFARELFMYDELYEPSTVRAIPLHAMVPGVAGSLNVGHPQACEAMTIAAQRAGAETCRGVGEVVVRPGPEPELAYQVDGSAVVVRARLVIGADGRSSIVRRQCGISLHETDAKTMVGGLLVSGWNGWPVEANFNGVEGDFFFLGFPRPNGLARLYLEWSIDGERRMTGRRRSEEFIEVFRSFTCLPSGCFADIEPAGPIASYPMTDSWTEDPTVDGVVLVGDAAGWSDPTLGQGLSVAMRDVRLVSELLLGDDAWNRATFEPYVHERSERMRRLRITREIILEALCDFSDRGRERRRVWRRDLARDPRLLQPVAVQLSGPESAPAELMTTDAIELVRALGS